MIAEPAEHSHSSRTLWARGLKRLVELALCIVGLAAAAPILATAIVVHKITSPGPAFFPQVRTGRDGREFRPYKLRTMTAGRTPDPEELVPLDHPGITSVGRFLRSSKIDELPQIFNVIRGEMSLVGPRPTLPEQTREYDEFQRRRLSVRPGLTGLAQVNGSTAISWDERIKYDVYYVRHHGVLMDVGVLLRTLLVVVLGEARFAVPFDKSVYAARSRAE